MANVKPRQIALPIAGVLFINGVEVDNVLLKLHNDIGDIAIRSEPIPFHHTEYYNEEMGSKIMRQWVAFNKTIYPDMLADIKIRTNDLEKEHLNAHGGRTINIDPGYITMSNLVLASTKNYSHRIYLAKGIYAEVTLIFKKQAFHPLDWTYPDYRESIALEFFDQARNLLKEKITSKKP